MKRVKITVSKISDEKSYNTKYALCSSSSEGSSSNGTGLISYSANLKQVARKNRR